MRKIATLLVGMTLVLFYLTYHGFKKLNLSPLSEQTIRLTLDDKIDSLDPAKAFTDDSLLVSAQVMEPLYQYHYLKRPYELEPLLADGLPEVSQNGTLIRIKIKKNVFYHPHEAFLGKRREVIADDFILQFKRLSLHDLQSPGRGLFIGIIEGFDEYPLQVQNKWEQIFQTDMSGIEAIDRYTIQLRLKKNEPNLGYYLALNFISPTPKEIITYYQNNLDNVLIGTGPYIFKNYNNGIIEMDKNRTYREDYYPSAGDRYANLEKLLDSSKERIPFVDKLKFYVTASEGERWEKFFKDEIDILTVPKSFISKIYGQAGSHNTEIKNKGIVVKHFPILANRWLAFNMKNPLFGKNDNLRKAIAHAINYERYIELLSNNTNLRANSILVPGISGYLPAKEFRFNYNPDLAKEFLRKAGYGPNTSPLTLVYSTRGNQSINVMEAEFFKEHLEAIGLKIKIEVITFPEFLKRGRAGELSLFTDNWLFDYPDGENIFQLLISKNSPGINKSGYSNPDMDRLYEELKKTSNVDKRYGIINEMESIAYKEIPWIPLMYESSFVLLHPKIKNFRKSSIIRNYIKYLKIED
jgi:oligopeptide transport system substrate-binding protein